MAGEQPAWLFPRHPVAPAPAFPHPPPPGNSPLPHPGPPILLLINAPRPSSLPSCPPPTHPLSQATRGRAS